MTDRYRVVLVDADTMRSWEIWTGDVDPAPAAVAKVAAAVEVPLFLNDGRNSFLWLCPGCGTVRAGRIGTEAIGGWENPLWVLSDMPDRPTLTPSLGCPAWRNGRCPDGRWWLRDGELVRA